MTEAAGKDLSDVLTSLRKLVADEPELDTIPQAVEKQDKPEASSETLVLCPSLRVDEEEVSEPPSLEAKITKLEKLIAHSDQLWEPDDVEQDDFAGSKTTIPLDVVSEAGREIVETALVQNEQVSTTLATSESASLDQEELRALVADMIRDELRGALGEQITKNIRKLVRREINSALINQRID